MLTKDEAQKIASAVNMLRPDWGTSGLLTILGDSRIRERRTYRDTAVAFTALATDPQSVKPTRILEHGPWWETARPAAGSPSASAFIRPPASDDCDICGLPKTSPHAEHEYVQRDSSGKGRKLPEPLREAIAESMAATAMDLTAAPTEEETT